MAHRDPLGPRRYARAEIEALVLEVDAGDFDPFYGLEGDEDGDGRWEPDFVCEACPQGVVIGRLERELAQRNAQVRQLAQQLLEGGLT